MSKQANPTVIGGFVLGALALVVVGLLTFTSGAWFRERVQMVTYFNTTVQGLTLGSQVLFEGVPVGQVTDIGVDYVPARETFRIPVHYEIWPRQLHILGAAKGENVRQLLHQLVEKHGLRAKLESVSFVTGQYVITLGLEPDAPPVSYTLEPKGPVRVPPTPATREQLEELFRSIDITELIASATGALKQLDALLGSPELKSALSNLDKTLHGTDVLLAELNGKLGPLLTDIDQAVAQYGGLAESLNTQIKPLAKLIEERVSTASADISSMARNVDANITPVATAAVAALDQVRAAMQAIGSLTGEGSTTRYQLSELLSQATRAAESLRSLADYLERHPEALLQGKR
ncbi:MAG: MlaD family protein [Thiohalocapsa sp.]|jgi:paraquat-inducible protein B|uniref:MlaD family protein n=1 Tax=Thiohalocapsa sp. TaxID=2497641 RepID=UPI0025D65841|nr:MlaD family protein [Thiohalocapsa sp.]MCG6940409.1 MlaD family protein [Thiohalocapsa sp.]